MSPSHPSDSNSINFLICTACGTQFPTSDRQTLAACFICDDPRQYTPPSGQSFTTLSSLRASHTNEFHPFPGNDNTQFISIVTTPKLAIGQRAILVRTPAGNILWDCLTLLDQSTITKIKETGGLAGIVISHPHYYSTHVEWATAFDCPVYLAAEDKEWIARKNQGKVVFLEEIETVVRVGGEDTGVRVVKLGGHFPGSLVLLYNSHLLIADTLMTTPSGLANWTVDALGQPRRSRPAGANSFSFMWSIPNQIPLSADEIIRMWDILRGYQFTSTHGAFVGQDIYDAKIKGRVLESMQIQIKYMGYGDHPFLSLVE